MKLIQVDEGLKAKLEKNEGTFEKDDNLEIYFIIEKIVKYFHHFIQVIIIINYFSLRLKKKLNLRSKLWKVDMKTDSYHICDNHPICGLAWLNF